MQSFNKMLKFTIFCKHQDIFKNELCIFAKINFLKNRNWFIKKLISF